VIRGMRRQPGRHLLEILLLCASLGLGGAAALGLGGDATGGDILYFAAWCAAMLLLFSLGLSLPLHLRGRLARPAHAAIAIAAIALAMLGNIALYRHDAHFDVTVNGRYTAPPELETIAGSLRHDVLLTYFYNGKDQYADAARAVLAIVAYIVICALIIAASAAALRDRTTEDIDVDTEDVGRPGPQRLDRGPWSPGGPEPSALPVTCLGHARRRGTRGSDRLFGS